MSIIGSNILAGASGQAGGGGAYEIERSVRFNSADSAYLSRTPGTAGNRKTWTWAGWVKKSKLKGGGGDYSTLFAAGTNNFVARFDTSEALEIYEFSGSFTFNYITSAVYRDLSAWFHVVLAVDTTNGTASDRVKLYINGSRVTTFSTATNPSLNADGTVNTTVAHYIGRASNDIYYDGYLADVHFIDGQALDPTSFGEFDTNGVWQPIDASGLTFGTNGFRLPFSDNSTAAALGTDTSSNGNTWTVNNISVTAGVGNDSLVDSPTNGSQTDTGVGGEVVGNYATLNPLWPYGAATYSNGNLDVVTDGASYGYTLSNIGPSSGKWYAEFGYTANSAGAGSQYCQFGIASKLAPSIGYYLGQETNAWGFSQHIGGYYSGGPTAISYGSTWSVGNTLSIALDKDNNKLYFAINGVWQNSANPAAGTGGVDISSASGLPAFFAVGDLGGGIVTGSLNFGQRQWAYAAPAGFKALCTTNLPEPTIADGSTVMDVKTWTGDGTTGTGSITGFAFSPDLVWAKSRSAANSHLLYDTVRGASTSGSSKALVSNATAAEGSSNDDTTYGYLSSFDSDGFSYFGGSSPAYFSQNGSTFVAWAWDAGSSTVTNTEGSITSQVRANASAGFSVVTYTGNGSTGTVGHGLGVAPSMVLIKNRSASQDWVMWFTGLTVNQYFYFDVTDGIRNFTGSWGALPTSSVFSTFTDQNNTNNYVAYCFAPVSGYSSGFSYTGNGSADGVFQFLGFRPRLIMLKRSDSTSNWTLLDTSREGYNVDNDPLYPNLSDAEGTTDLLDITSNGFKLRSTDASVNASAATYIGFAWAENPFQYARAR